MGRETIRWTGPTPADPFRGLDKGVPAAKPVAAPDAAAAAAAADVPPKRAFCKPGKHRWATPAAGDEALRCERCPRALPLGDLDAFHRGGIVNSMNRQLGPEGGAAFEEALTAAMRAARAGA